MTKLQIKTSPLTSKILKLVKGLNKFTVEDIQRLIDCEESDILLSLKELEDNSCIKKISQTEYLFMNIKITESKHQNRKTTSGEWLTVEDVCKITGETSREVKHKCKNNIYINIKERNGKFLTYYINASSIANNNNQLEINLSKQDLNKLLVDIEHYKNLSISKILKSKTECDFYNNLNEDLKKTVIKYLVLFKFVDNTPNLPTKEVLADIAQKYPYYTICNLWYKRKYKCFKNGGLEELLFSKYSTLDFNVYKEFKKIYFTSKDCSLAKAYNILSEKIGKENMPTLCVIGNRLRKEYTRQYIKNIQKLSTYSNKVLINDFLELTNGNNTKDNIDEKGLLNYKNATNEHDDSENKNLNKEEEKLITSSNTWKIGNIIDTKIKNFKEKLIVYWAYLVSDESPLSLLSKLLFKYRITPQKYDMLKNIIEISPLSIKQINKIINNNSPDAWIIGLGVRSTELTVLEYEDIDFKNQIAIINKSKSQDRKQKFYSRTAIRHVKIPSLLFSKLDSNGKGPIFKEVNIENYEQLAFTHIMLMSLNNVPMNIIAKNMGYSLRDFYSLYHKAFLQELDKNFDIFKGVQK